MRCAWVHAPANGESSGWFSVPLRALGTTAGRTMLGALKLLLDRIRLFNDAESRRLPALLMASRRAQASVSATLATQVLGALHDLLRGLHAAAPDATAALARQRSEHLYEGLLAVLMRLVFLLYAEDRGLIPSRDDPASRTFYEANYGVRGLHARLSEDAALHPDTMDGRHRAVRGGDCGRRQELVSRLDVSPAGAMLGAPDHPDERAGPMHCGGGRKLVSLTHHRAANVSHCLLLA